ncbi:MAG TPA: MBL fold metallo-hydrolase, partial [Candidatus Polarisedimenticolia bacterium]|nr:MBL fold metallo-hydrolase [Candidatus Polarisedimenticolia bacterium]
LGGIDVAPFTVLHGTVPILGYRIGGLAYITDGIELPDDSFNLLRGVDALVINALRRKPHPTHFNLQGALEAIERVGPRRAFLTHISHDFDHAELERELPAGVQPAHDGLSFDVSHNV